MRSSIWRPWLSLGWALTASAVTVDMTSESSVKEAASTLAYGLMKYYTGNDTGDNPGNLPSPYYWWEAGAFFGTYVDYWAYTGDDTYVNVTYQALQSQVGDDHDFMPSNQTLDEGNDDQGFWAMAAMTAAEMGFQDPTTSGVQWLALAQAVFNEYAWRWDNTTCGGGLRWQIWSFNSGYTYKNTIANGCFFNLAAHLARYTNNATYAEWAEKVYTWTTDIGFIDDKYNVYDGASDTTGCNDTDLTQWTYNAGIYLEAAAVMYNYTNGSSVWETRVLGLLNRTVELFFNNSVMYEPACEPQNNCDVDDLSFKAYLVRWMSKTTQMMASTYDTIYPLLVASATGAAAQCDGTATASKGYELAGYACGAHWVWGSDWDASSGVGQQMAGLSAVFYTLVQNAVVPLTSSTGGTSTGDSSAGTDKTEDDLATTRAITTGDRVGAGILTALVLGGLFGGVYFVMML
ncbi:glycoside hydrolase family 76 protein [Xylariales sp. PMI_506]|nr:glycoside hydrolase family 76 protein [Xylariales sp. PMI_506]